MYAAKTGESFAAALRHVRPAQQADTTPEVSPVRLAAAQVVVRDDPRDRGRLRQSGRDVRELMRQAHQAGARIIHFPVGATCSPHKWIMSVAGPAKAGPADWGAANWQASGSSSRRSPASPASSGCGQCWDPCTR